MKKVDSIKVLHAIIKTCGCAKIWNIFIIYISFFLKKQWSLFFLFLLENPLKAFFKYLTRANYKISDIATCMSFKKHVLSPAIVHQKSLICFIHTKLFSFHLYVQSFHCKRATVLQQDYWSCSGLEEALCWGMCLHILLLHQRQYKVFQVCWDSSLDGGVNTRYVNSL